jgi:thiamine-monophosphate kinase
MDIKQFGGEFALIKDITKDFKIYDRSVVKAVGDDAAVIKRGKGYEVITTDTMVEGDHFHCGWSTPYQIGRKLVEVNVSDVVAMGADPELLLVNLVLRDGVDVQFVQELYRAIKDGCDRYKITLLGGDTTHGKIMMLNATLTGSTKKPVLRSGAKVGDLVCLTGDVGASTAGFKMFLSGKKPTGQVWRRHIEPYCRYDLGKKIAKFAHSMIDVSDGVASEVRHICNESGVGALVDAKKIPIHPQTEEAAKSLGKRGLDFALSGGEDFELLFTISVKDLPKLQKTVKDFKVIGEITSGKKGVRYIELNGQVRDLPGGYDHFSLS